MFNFKGPLDLKDSFLLHRDGSREKARIGRRQESAAKMVNFEIFRAWQSGLQHGFLRFTTH